MSIASKRGSSARTDCDPVSVAMMSASLAVSAAASGAWAAACACASRARYDALSRRCVGEIPLMHRVSRSIAGHTPCKGAIVLYDWAGSRNIPAIDHVGIVEAVRSNSIVTIEGNTGNRVMRRERSGLVAGYGYPAYSGTTPAPKPTPAELTWTEKIVKTLPTLKLGARGYDVKTVFYLLHARGLGLSGSLDDTVLGESLDEALRRFQKAAHLTEDGECGPKTWAALLRVV
ncbi:peptidoglycan-binding protein [Nonomuraea sp. NPDC049141]|uniref:peptidoglycan-binding protein n=1 Tax=Nonomuraea sp. NPDC049141 TaxID=3155500 RepID=UPI00340612EE